MRCGGPAVLIALPQAQDAAPHEGVEGEEEGDGGPDEGADAEEAGIGVYDRRPRHRMNAIKHPMARLKSRNMM